MNITAKVADICRKLDIDNERFVEIETKQQLKLRHYKAVRQLVEKLGAKHKRSASFFDQYLDTPGLMICKKGASLRIRYKQHGTKVYIQYKGPGFIKDGILFRSEFNSGRIDDVVLEESSSHIVHFNEKTIRAILLNHIPDEMAAVMRRHVGEKILSHISVGHLICAYSKDKFALKRKNVLLEPSLDTVYSFYVARQRIHPMSIFCEYENEIKAVDNALGDKLKSLNELLDFNRKITSRFPLPQENKDKYHRCMSYFIDVIGG
jgi:hypothetical protein